MIDIAQTLRDNIKPTPEYTAHGMTLPSFMKDAITRYVQYGDLPGHFLTAVLENNLKEAVGRADDEMLKIIPVFVIYLYNEVNSLAWGSKDRVTAWVNAKRREAAAAEAAPSGQDVEHEGKHEAARAT